AQGHRGGRTFIGVGGHIAQVGRADNGRLLVILDRDGLGAGGGVGAGVADGPGDERVANRIGVEKGLAVVAGGADAGHRAVVGGGGRAQGHCGGRTFIGIGGHIAQVGRADNGRLLVILDRDGLGAGGGVGAGVADGPGDERVANRIGVGQPLAVVPFPYTTLFRSVVGGGGRAQGHRGGRTFIGVGGHIAQVGRADNGRLLVILDRDGLGAGGGVGAGVADGPGDERVANRIGVEKGLAVVAGGADAGHRAVVGGGGRAQGHCGGRTFIGVGGHIAQVGRADNGRLLVVLDRDGLGAGGGVGAGVADGPGDERVANRIGVGQRLAVVAGGADAGHRAVVGGGGRAQGHRGGRTFIGVGGHIGQVGRADNGRLLVILDRDGLGAGGGVGAGVADGPGDERVANRIGVGQRLAVVAGGADAGHRAVVGSGGRAQGDRGARTFISIGGHIAQVGRARSGGPR